MGFTHKEMFLPGMALASALVWCIMVVGPASTDAQQFARGERYNSSCRSTRDCYNSETFLECINTKCACTHHSLYDPSMGFCRIKHDGRCKHKGDSRTNAQCVRNALCAYPKDMSGNDLTTSVDGTCDCNYGKYPRSDGTCSSSNAVPTVTVSTTGLFRKVIFGVLSVFVIQSLS